MTHRLLVCLVFASLAAGCSRSPPVARPVTQQAGANAAVVPTPAEDRHNPDSAPIPGGQSGEQWAQGLGNRDAGKREQAAQALRALGDAGYPHLVKAMNSPVPEVRVQALLAMDLSQWVRNPNETIPLLIHLARDPDPTIREQSAIRLAWFDTTTPGGGLGTGAMLGERLQTVQTLAKNDSHPAVRQAAANSIRSIENAQRGKAIAD